MEPLHAAQFFCPKCSAEVSAEAAVCPRCGASMASSAAPAEKRDLLDNPWVVLGMLFLATGVLGLPFLWKSKGFSTFWKVIVGIVVTIYTAVLVWLAALAVMWAWRNAQPVLGHSRTVLCALKHVSAAPPNQPMYDFRLLGGTPRWG
jgi:hypothetical protein